MNLRLDSKTETCGYNYGIYKVEGMEKTGVPVMLEAVRSQIGEVRTLQIDFPHDRDNYVEPLYFSSYDDYMKSASEIDFGKVEKITFAGEVDSKRVVACLDVGFSTLTVSARGNEMESRVSNNINNGLPRQR